MTGRRGDKHHTTTYHPSMNRSNPSAAESTSEVSAALVPRSAELAADIYHLIVQEIPALDRDRRVLALLEASVAENVSTMLHVLQHGIDLENVRAPAAAEEYARRLAQQGVPLAALLRAYRIGSARFEEWCLQELGRRTDSGSVISATGMRIAGTLNAYIDGVSEELVSAYEAEKEKWLRNQSAARAARVRALLRNEQPSIDASEAILGYRLRQYHLGVVTWITGAPAGGDTLGLLERAAGEVAAQAQCDGRLMFVPQDESSAWAWLPLGGRRDVPLADMNVKDIGGGDRIQFAFGEPALGVTGFRRTHQQAVSAQAVALAAGPAAPPVTAFAEVAPLALMSGSLELLRVWVAETLGPLADDDDHNARLRDTVRVFLQENGSYKATAERLVLHKNTVQYRVRKAEESLQHPVVQDRLRIELALLAAQWLGVAVLRPAGGQP
jgi:PucR C-terminal helix-turn-helix domain/GGDEF-like domain